jgi:hypothetical protein
MTLVEAAFELASRMEKRCDSTIAIYRRGIHSCTKDKGHDGEHVSGEWSWTIELTIDRPWVRPLAERP